MIQLLLQLFENGGTLVPSLDLLLILLYLLFLFCQTTDSLLVGPIFVLLGLGLQVLQVDLHFAQVLTDILDREGLVEN